MAAVNWDQPSSGTVNDSNPALVLNNDKNGALVAESSGVAVAAESKDGEAIVAQIDTTLTGRFTSNQFVAVLAYAPEGIGVLGGNYNGQWPATAGFSLSDPALPNVNDNPGGIGALGRTDRFMATGVAGIATGPRSTGVHGEAPVSGVGVRGLGSERGVEGSSSAGYGVTGFTDASAAAGVYGSGTGQSAGVRGEAIAGPGVDAHSSAGPGLQALSDQAHGVRARPRPPTRPGCSA